MTTNPQYLIVTDRQTNNLPWQYRTHCVASRGKNDSYVTDTITVYRKKT